MTDWELASRLSYFLWSSMPDQALFDLAARGELDDPAVLRAQVDRMLADPRANTLGDVFAGQWLGFHHVGTRVRLDPIDHPWCTDTLMTAMRDETSMFFMSLLRDDMPIDVLIDADYTFANEELAATLYGRDDVEGDRMRRVSLDDPNRGGIIAHPSVLALTSNYMDTSPVKRGTYVLGTILGTPPPEPPPNAGILSEEVAQMENMSFREKIEMHSQNEYCRGCHSRIDPIGFSLENFDAFGRWRERYEFRERVETAEEADESFEFQTEKSPEPIWIHLKHIRKPIFAEGNLPGGAGFDGPAGLKRAILTTRHHDLVRQVTTKMLSFALGRQLEYYDEPAVRKIIAALEADEYRFRTLLQEIVTSYPFQYKKKPGGKRQWRRRTDAADEKKVPDRRGRNRRVAHARVTAGCCPRFDSRQAPPSLSLLPQRHSAGDLVPGRDRRRRRSRQAQRMDEPARPVQGRHHRSGEHVDSRGQRARQGAADVAHGQGLRAPRHQRGRHFGRPSRRAAHARTNAAPFPRDIHERRRVFFQFLAPQLDLLVRARPPHGARSRAARDLRPDVLHQLIDLGRPVSDGYRARGGEVP